MLVSRRVMRGIGAGLGVIGLVLGVTPVTTGAMPRLAASKPSIVEGLPVPVQAKLLPTPFYGSTGRYLLPVGVSLRSADAWYNRHLPAGKPWRGWSPDTRATTGTLGFSRSWQRGRTYLVLGTTWNNVSHAQVEVTMSIIPVVTVKPGATHFRLPSPQPATQP
jgi:hypothetical protein